MSRKATSVLLILVAVVLMSLGATQAQDIPTGGTVVVSQAPRGAWAANFNPLLSSALSDGTRQLIYDPMVVWDPLDGGQPTWWLATDYQYADDAQSITFTLRDGVKWSDGEVFNADDVVYTMNLVLGNAALDRYTLADFVVGVEKVDDLTVTFTLSDVYSLAHIQIGKQRIVPEHIWKDVADPVTFVNEDPVGTGPFTEVTDFSDQYYKICKNPYFWMPGQPYVDCIAYPAFTSNDQANLAIIAGEVDWGGLAIPDIDNVFVGIDPEFNHRWFVGINPWGFYVNSTKSPFDDVKFRQALAQATDYGTIATTAENGYIETPQEVAAGIWPQFKDYVPQAVLDKIKEMGLGVFDIERAKATLDEAGYVDADGDGWRDMPDGSAIAFTIQIVNGWTDVVTAAQIMSQGFQDAGLNASVVTPDQTTFQDNLNRANFDTSLGWAIWGESPWNFFDNLMNSYRLDPETGVTTAQFTARIYDPAWDQLLQDYLRTADEAEQKEIIGQLVDAYVTNVVHTQIGVFPAWYEYTDRKFTGFPNEEDPYAVGAPWQEETARVVAVNLHCVDAANCD